MARFAGAVGYGLTEESPPGSGIWVDRISEATYYGDVTKVTTRLKDGDGLNQDIVSDHRVSVLADAKAIEFWNLVKYVEWAGVLWTVKTAELVRPRLILYLGGVYNGPRAEPDESGEAPPDPDID